MHVTKIVRSLGITVGIVAGTAAAASAATGGGFIPTFHSEPAPTTTTEAPKPAETTTTTRKSEPAPTTTAKKPEPPRPTTTVAHEPATTTTKAPEPTTTKPTEPAPTTTAKKPEPPRPTTTVRHEPTPTAPKPSEPTPSSSEPKNEVHTPASLSLACHGELAGDQRVVTCEWQGDAAGGTFLLLRSQPSGGPGRVLVQSADAHRFVDTTAQRSTAYVYLVIVLKDGVTTAHSNAITMA